MRWALAFESPSAEKAFVRRRNQQLVRQDVSWSLFWTFQVAGGVFKWARAEHRDYSELAWILPYFLCCPALLAAIRLRPRWYVRRRVAAITALRLARTFFFMSCVHRWEAIYLGAAAGTTPTTPFAIVDHLAWRPSAQMMAGLGFVTPFRAFLPFQLLYLVLSLRATAQRCLGECAAGGAAATAAGAAAATAGAAAAAGEPAGATPAAGAGCSAAQRYYERVLGWIRSAVPVSRRLPLGWRLGPGGCVASCYAVHAWLQGALGVLLTLALLWGWEERLRCRELKAWRLRLQQLQQQEGEPRQQPPEDLPPPSPRWLRMVAIPEPLPSLALAAGWVAACWGLWVLLEVAFLPPDAGVVGGLRAVRGLCAAPQLPCC